MVGDCRSLLTHAAVLGERAGALRRGDIQTLRIAASAITIEGLFPTFLGRYARRHPDVKLAPLEADAAQHLGLLERGEAHLAINVVNMLQADEQRFAIFMLPQFQVLAACAPSFGIERADTIDIRRLVRHPLLAPHASFPTRNIFDAACRLAGVRPNVLLESTAAHALLALAEAGHGVAIIPSILWPDRRSLQVMRVTHRREPLWIALALLWDRRRTLPRCAADFPLLLTAHIREAFPHTRSADGGMPYNVARHAGARGRRVRAG